MRRASKCRSIMSKNLPARSREKRALILQNDLCHSSAILQLSIQYETQEGQTSMQRESMSDEWTTRMMPDSIQQWTPPPFDESPLHFFYRPENSQSCTIADQFIDPNFHPTLNHLTSPNHNFDCSIRTSSPKRLSAKLPWRCAECLTESTPLKRGGPLGRQTLCNACGIRYGLARAQRRKANETKNSGKSARPDQKRAEHEIIRMPSENKTAKRRPARAVPRKRQRHNFEIFQKEPGIAPFSYAVEPSLVQEEAVPISANFESGPKFPKRRAKRHEQNEVILTKNSNLTPDQHLTFLEMNKNDTETSPLSMTSPYMPTQITCSPSKPFLKQPLLTEQSPVISTPRVFLSAQNLTGTDLQHEKMKNSDEKITFQEVNPAILEGTQQGINEVHDEISLREGSVRWCDDFARRYPETGLEEQQNTQNENIGTTEITSLPEASAAERNAVMLRNMQTLSELQNVNDRLSRNVTELSKRIDRFTKKYQEINAARDGMIAVIKQLITEKEAANAKRELICRGIAKTECILNQLQQNRGHDG